MRSRRRGGAFASHSSPCGRAVDGRRRAALLIAVRPVALKPDLRRRGCGGVRAPGCEARRPPSNEPPPSIAASCSKASPSRGAVRGVVLTERERLREAGARSAGEAPSTQDTTEALKRRCRRAPLLALILQEPVHRTDHCVLLRAAWAGGRRPFGSTRSVSAFCSESQRWSRKTTTKQLYQEILRQPIASAAGRRERGDGAAAPARRQPPTTHSRASLPLVGRVTEIGRLREV